MFFKSFGMGYVLTRRECDPSSWPRDWIINYVNKYFQCLNKKNMRLKVSNL